MGRSYLINSNAIIGYTSNRLSQKASDFADHLFDTNFQTSVVVKIEVLGFDHYPEKLRSLEEFIGSATIINLDEEIIEKTILLRRKYKKLKLGDAIIASTAIVQNCTLITRNLKDFSNIKGLKLLNLWDYS